MKRFENFSSEHFLYLNMFTLAMILLLILVKFIPKKHIKTFEIAFALITLFIKFSHSILDVLYDQGQGWIMVLPLHLCTMMGLVMAISLFYSNTDFTKKYIFPIAYFSIAPAFVALFNADTLDLFILLSGFFYDHFFMFFIAIYYMIYKGYRLEINALGYITMVLFSYALFMFCFDLIFDANFLYLIKGTKSDTIVKILGKFPFFSISFVGIAIIAFAFQYYIYFFVMQTARLLKHIVLPGPIISR